MFDNRIFPPFSQKYLNNFIRHTWHVNRRRQQHAPRCLWAARKQKKKEKKKKTKADVESWCLHRSDESLIQTGEQEAPLLEFLLNFSFYAQNLSVVIEIQKWALTGCWRTSPSLLTTRYTKPGTRPPMSTCWLSWSASACWCTPESKDSLRS